MKKRLLAAIFVLACLGACMFLEQSVAAVEKEGDYYKQSFYFEDLSGETHLIATNYADENGNGYSYVYDKNGATTKCEYDDAIEKAYTQWVEGTYRFHYFSALRFASDINAKDGTRRIQRVGVDMDSNVYALYYKCINSTEGVGEDDPIDSSNTFGFRRRQYTKNDKMIYYWVKVDPVDASEILVQLGPDWKDELDPNATTTAEPTTTAQTTKAPETTEKPTVAAKVGKATVSSVKKKKSAKKAKVVIKKLNGVSGYEVQFAKKSNFKKILLKKTITKVTLTVTSAKFKNTVIYVRARGYKKIEGGKKYGAWSAAKKSK